MLVVSDVVDVILPLPEDLLVNLQESRESIDILLDSLPSMFSASKALGGMNIYRYLYKILCSVLFV